MSVLRTVRELLFPPKCLGCGIRLAPSLGKHQAPVLCSDCRQEFERSMLCQCSRCFAAYRDCTCAHYNIQKAGCLAFVKLAPYGEEDELQVVRRMVLDNKNRPNGRSVSFLAGTLLEGLKKALVDAEEKQAISHTVVAHMPRSRRNVRRYGFDQAKGLAKAVAHCAGLPHATLLRRVHDGVEQKTLSVRERAANVKGAFALNGSVAGKRVILVDDVVTTGAGMAEAIRVLKKGGAAQVIAVAVAETRKKIGE